MKITEDNYKSIFSSVIILIICGIAINIGGAQLAKALKLPLFLDCIGTILIAATGGYLPGAIVGFLSNMINALNDPANAYYTLLSVLIGLCAAFYARRGYFRSIWKALLLTFPLAIIGGALGSILTYLIYGFGFGEGISLGLARTLYQSGNLSLFFAQFISDMIIDLADKFVSLVIVYFILQLVNKRFGNNLEFHSWHQKPLSEEDQIRANKSQSKAMSLRSKILLLIVIATLFIAAITTGISFTLYRRATIDEHTQMGIGVAGLAATIINGDDINRYLEEGESAEGYAAVERQLQKVRQSSHEIEYVYVYKILEDGCHVVFDLDTEDTPGGDPGDIVEFDEAFAPYLDDLIAGKEIRPIVSDETFGWLLTVYEPIVDSRGITQAYACVDISMEEVTLNEISFLVKVISMFLGFFLMIITIGLWLAEYNLILPINTMSLAAMRFAYKNEGEIEENADRFKDLRITTGDEIENLYDSFSMTIEETVKYIAETQKQAQAINKMQNGLILVLADMVESRDQCTGDHVRKTAAYCRVILDHLRKQGLYPELLTDDYIEDVVNSAPLHDIGKIKVPDAILNKPGKLTDEEFNEIKKHTIAGKEIIEQAIDLVAADSSYLKEAKNLATYHHEKWNGKGYPYGLDGEDIPLSARVMAVADVFDALVSKRSYKEPFSFEKAMEIIEEGSGNHFDPKIVEAFKAEVDEVRRISETFMGGNLEVPKAEA
ncbi:MAG: HD domain-containing protein [Erysipelotrichaceae bacterium]|nr:HD domain-containing protein [Erysipelotrichaceae bacterium]